MAFTINKYRMVNTGNRWMYLCEATVSGTTGNLQGTTGQHVEFAYGQQIETLQSGGQTYTMSRNSNSVAEANSNPGEVHVAGMADTQVHDFIIVGT